MHLLFLLYSLFSLKSVSPAVSHLFNSFTGTALYLWIPAHDFVASGMTEASGLGFGLGFGILPRYLDTSTLSYRPLTHHAPRTTHCISPYILASRSMILRERLMELCRDAIAGLFSMVYPA